MSDMHESMDTDQGISRREALKLSAMAAGTAAFATPIVVGAFSAPALAQVSGCDPATDSDAVSIEAALKERWNQNCAAEGRWGRYNSQRSDIPAPELGPGQTVGILFGGSFTDNFHVECSWYTIDPPAGCVCTATWGMELASGGGTPGCKPGFSQAISTPTATCDPTVGAPPPDALPLPYCKPTNGSDGCPSSQKLRILQLVCCCTH